jgi:hypothetical protein
MLIICTQTQAQVASKNKICKEWRLIESIYPNFNRPVGIDDYLVDTIKYSLDSSQVQLTFKTDNTYLKQTTIKNVSKKTDSIIKEEGAWKIEENPNRIIFYCNTSKVGKDSGCMQWLIIELEENSLKLEFQTRGGSIKYTFVPHFNQNK